MASVAELNRKLNKLNKIYEKSKQKINSLDYNFLYCHNNSWLSSASKGCGDCKS